MSGKPLIASLGRHWVINYVKRRYIGFPGVSDLGMPHTVVVYQFGSPKALYTEKVKPTSDNKVRKLNVVNSACSAM